MRAVTWHGRADVRVDTVPDPVIQDPTDVIVEITSSGVCGSDLHLIEVMAPFMSVGDVMGHEPMGIVREVGREVTAVKPGDRVVVPFNISCNTCWMCSQGLNSQCETTQNRDQGMGASLFGYTKLYGQVPGGQAEYLRVPFGNTLPIKVPDAPLDDRFVYLSDVLPTAWQAVQYAGIPDGGSVLVLGLGPIGDMCTRIAKHLGAGQVIASDVVPERLARARRNGITVIDSTTQADVVAEVRDLTDGRGADVTFEVTGTQGPLGVVGDVTRMSGKIVIVGYHQGEPRAIPLGHWNWMAFTIVNAHFRDVATIMRGMRIGMRLLTSRRLVLDRLVSHRFALTDIGEAFATAHAKPEGFVKATVQIGAAA